MPGPRTRESSGVPAKVEALRAEGKSFREIASSLGISETKAWECANLDRQRRRDARKHRQAYSRKKREAERRRRKLAQPLDELYSMVERLQDVVAQAHRAAEAPEARRELAEAGRAGREMRDYVVRARGTW